VDEASDQSESEPEEKIRIQRANLKINTSPTQVNKIRDWDIGNEGLFAPKSATTQSRSTFISQERYIVKKRDERNTEFAPPSSYHEKPDSTYTSAYKRFKPSANNSSFHHLPSDHHEDLHSTSDNNPPDIATLIGDQISQIRRNLDKNSK